MNRVTNSNELAAMIWLLRGVFEGVLITMLCVTGRASAQVPLWRLPADASIERLLLRQRA